MGFHYAKAAAKMKADFARTREICEREGMPEKDIQNLYEFDKNILNRDRVFYAHNQSYEEACFEDGAAEEERSSPLLKQYIKQISVFPCEISEWGRYDWAEDIDDDLLARFVKQMRPQDIELLTLIIADGLTQREVAKMLGVSPATVSKRIGRIRKTAKKYCKKS